MLVGETGTYEVCGLRAGYYRVAFARDPSELVVDVVLRPGQRYRVDVCETTLAIARWPLVDDAGDYPPGGVDYTKHEPPRQIERCP